MSDAGAPVARFGFTNGPHKDTHLTLHASCVVHRGADESETIPLATLASVRVAFVHDPHRVAWGVVAIAVAAILFGISSPLAHVAETAAADLAGNTSGVGIALHALFRVIGAAARALPLLALASILGGVALAALGWMGSTVLTFAFGGVERTYRVRGRNTPLIDFAEAISQRLMMQKR